MSSMNLLQYCEVVKSENYIAFPDMAITPENTLLCTYFEGDLHVPNWSQIVVKTSKDYGKTWASPIVLAKASYQEHGHCWNCPRISTLPDGRLVIICDYQDRSEERAVWAWWSDDQGRSWSEPGQILGKGLCPDRIIALSSGRLLMTVACEGAGQTLFFSDDGGASWQELSIVHPEAVEGSLVALDETTFLCYLRANEFFSPKAISTNAGKTWPHRTDTPFIGHRPCAGLLTTGRILVTYRHPGAGTYAYLEEQGSARSAERDKQNGAVLELDGGGGNYWWDYGYSAWIELPDSRIFCVYYTKSPVDHLPSPEPKPFIRGVWFSESDFAVGHQGHLG